VPRAPPSSYFLITRIVFSEDYRSWSSSLCSLLHSPVILSLLGPNIFLSTLLSNLFSVMEIIILKQIKSMLWFVWLTTSVIVLRMTCSRDQASAL
jgi:hypothetical protein